MKIVIVEDSEPIQRLLVKRLEETCFVVVGLASSAEEAVRLVVESRPDAVVLDLKLSPGSGIWVLTQLRASGVRAKILMFSSEDPSTYSELCRIRGADGFFDKAYGADDLIAALQTLCRQSDEPSQIST